MVHPLAVLNEAPFDRRINGRPDLPLFEVDIDPSARIGPFVVVCQGIDGPTRVGARTMIEAGTVVGHDAQIGPDVEIASLSGIGGYAIVRKGARLGTGVRVQPYVCVGEGARVGTGAVVTRHVMAGETVAGVPAKPLPARDQDRLKCGCDRREVWDGCPHHGSKPVC